MIITNYIDFNLYKYRRKTWKGEIKKQVKKRRKKRHLPDSCLQIARERKKSKEQEKTDAFSKHCNLTRSPPLISPLAAPASISQSTSTADESHSVS